MNKFLRKMKKIEAQKYKTKSMKLYDVIFFISLKHMKI
jgi:hypothetical protein